MGWAPAGRLDELLASARALTDLPATLVEDLTFSNRAVVARLRLPNGETVVAKRHASYDAHATEVEAMQLLPGDTRPALVAAGDGTIVMEDLGTGPSLADLLRGPTAVRRSARCTPGPAPSGGRWRCRCGRAPQLRPSTWRPVSNPSSGSGRIWQFPLRLVWRPTLP